MVHTFVGFKIAEKDLELRGPGEIDGTKQSGLLQFKLANLVEDKRMVEAVSEEVDVILQADPNLEHPEHLRVQQFLKIQRGKTAWSKIA